MYPNASKVPLDALNEQFGVKTPASIFKACPRCKRSDLFEFEGEVFCNLCQWDSVLINAEVLALALLRFDQRCGKISVTVKPRVTAISTPYLHLFFPSEDLGAPGRGASSPRSQSSSSSGAHSPSSRGRRPEVA